MSKIAKELAAATNVNLSKGETLADPGYLKRLIKAVADLKDPAWNELSKEAQDWFNDAADKANAKKDIPAFPDAEPDADEEKPRTRRRSAEPEPEQASALKKDDVVTIVTGRGKEVTGTVVDPDDNGELVLMVGEGKDAEEVGYGLSKLQSITVVKPPKVEADEEKPRRRRAAEDDEPVVVEPEVSDSVEVTTQSGRTKLGNIVEISDDTLVIKDAAGEEIEYARSKVKSIVVKVKNAKPAGKAGDDDEKPRRRAAAGDADPKAGEADKKARASKDDNGGVSVTTRARELMCEDPLDPMSLADLEKAIAKEKLTCNPNTLKMVHADCVKLFGLLKAAKHLK